MAVRLSSALALAACVAGPRAAVTPASSVVELVGRLELPSEVVLDGVPVGGLSALVREDAEDLYLALADDPGEHGPPRLYRLRLVFDPPAPAAEVLSWRPLTDPTGEPYPSGAADPEGLALLPGGELLVASEGLADRGVGPFLRRFTADGRQLAEVALPERYLPSADGGRGVRPSLGFESLAIDPEGGRVYLATEGPLVQDGPAADVGTAALARLMILSWPRAERIAEHAYRIEPVRLTPRPADGFRLAGLVELLSLGSGRLLALERQYAAGAGFSLRLYAVGLAGAADLSRVDSLANRPAPAIVCKEMLLDFADLGLEPGNLEGLATGPAMADGRQTIVVVEDDNFAAGPAARFLRLALPVRLDRPPARLPPAESCW